MINFLTKYKYKIRTYIFFFLVCISYFFAIFYLFWNHDIFASIIAMFFLYIFSHFLAIDYKDLKIKYVIFFVLILVLIDTALFLFFSLDINIWLILSLLIYTSSLIILFYSLNSIGFNSISYFSRWGYLFTLVITIAYSFTLIWMFQHFPFTCEWLKSATNKLIEFIEKPIIAPIKKIQKTFSWNKKYLEESNMNIQVEEMLLWVQWIQISSQPNTAFDSMVKKINNWKENNIDQLLIDQKSYSQDICNILLQDINEKYMLKEVWLSAVMLIYFLLFGFIRLTIFVMSFIWFLLFKLLYRCWIYKIKKTKIEIFEIK